MRFSSIFFHIFFHSTQRYRNDFSFGATFLPINSSWDVWGSMSEVFPAASLVKTKIIRNGQIRAYFSLTQPRILFKGKKIINFYLWPKTIELISIICLKCKSQCIRDVRIINFDRFELKYKLNEFGHRLKGSH